MLLLQFNCNKLNYMKNTQKKIVFISGSNGMIGKRVFSILKNNKKLMIINLSLRLEQNHSEIDKYFSNNLKFLNNEVFLIHFAYDWNDQNIPAKNVNYVGSINLFNSFNNHFPNASIMNISTTVAKEQNQSSYSQVKTKLEKWIEEKEYYNLICGIFIDSPSFGQMRILEKISKLPFIFFPCKNNYVYLSSVSILAFNIKKIIMEQDKFKDSYVLCCCQPMKIYSLIKMIGMLYNQNAPKVFNFPYKPALILCQIIDWLTKSTRFEEKILGLNNSALLLKRKNNDKNYKIHLDLIEKEFLKYENILQN